MLKLIADGRTYAIEFRHVTKLGKRAQLYARSPIKAITTCVVVAENFIAIDNAICAQDDNFSRAEGRDRALSKILKHCGALKHVQQHLLAEYLKATNGQKPKAQRLKMSAEERQKKIESGSATRNRRLKRNEAH